MPVCDIQSITAKISLFRLRSLKSPPDVEVEVKGGFRHFQQLSSYQDKF